LSGLSFEVITLGSYIVYSNDAGFVLNNARASVWDLPSESNYRPHKEISPAAV
jgi:hypothetical protein